MFKTYGFAFLITPVLFSFDYHVTWLTSVLEGQGVSIVWMVSDKIPG